MPINNPDSISAKIKAICWARNARKQSLRSKPFKKIAQNGRQEKPKAKTSKTSHQAWHVVGGRSIFFRSGWEANYGKYLQWQKEQNIIRDWEHEPQTFWFEGIRRGVVSYLPDFKVTTLDGSHEWIEVKGYMDAKSLTKLKRFAKYFPKESLRVIDSKWYKDNKKKLSLVVPGWDKG